MDDLISRAGAIEWFFRPYSNEESYSNLDVERALKAIPAVDAVPVEWLKYMQQESLSENDRTMVGAIEAIFIEWHIYVNRLREMSRQKEQEAQDEPKV